MPIINFVDVHGTSRSVDAPAGSTVMETAIKHDVPGIVGECGGACACATCHVYVDDAWADIVGAAADMEKDMLDFLERVFRRDYEVVRAHSVDEAEAAIASRPVDVVITDRRMPKRGGLELLESLAKASPRTARILLTGYADSLVDEKVTQWRLVDAWV